MINIYYTAQEGRRNSCGHTAARGRVYIIRRGDNTTPHGVDGLEDIGDYIHHSGGAGIELSILDIVKTAGIDINGGYFGSHWREAVNLIRI